MTIELMLYEAMMIERRREMESALRHAGYGITWTKVVSPRPPKLRLGRLRRLGFLRLRRVAARRELHAEPTSR